MNAGMTKEQLIERLMCCAEQTDVEAAHKEADSALIEYINDDEVTAAYLEVAKYYA